MLKSLRANKWNSGSQYVGILTAYIAYVPTEPNEGNFLLANAKYRIIRSMFAAEQSFLPVRFAAELQILCEQHIGLQAYYPQTEDLHNSIRGGHLDAPLPTDAVEGFIKVIEDHTPGLLEPIVSQSLEGVAQPVSEVALDLEPTVAGPAQPAPPPDPLGEVDPVKSQRFNVASGINALWKVARSSGEQAGKNAEGWNKAFTTLAPYVEPILQFLRSFG